MKEGGHYRISVVIPALNEEKVIKDVLERLQRAAAAVKEEIPSISGVEILVVNDGSTDGTARVAASVEGVKVINSERRSGYGGALKKGFDASSGDWIVFLDADGTYPPEFLGKLAGAMLATDADVILGSRMAGDQSRMPLVRRAGNLFFAGLLSWITGKKITDSASGMRIFKRSLLALTDDLPEGLNFTPAMSTLALHMRLDIREIPMPYDERVGASKLNPVTDGMRFLRSILWTSFRYNPLKIFGVIGMFLIAVGVGYGVEPLPYYVKVRRVEDWEIYRLVTVIVLTTTGMNVLFFGVVANILLAATHRMAPFRNSLLARLLLRHAVVNKLWLVGVVLMGGAVILNREGLYTYFVSGKVYLHWSYTITGSHLFLLGVTFLLWGSLVKVVEGMYGEGRSTPVKNPP